jgi:hypothetical protein
MSFGIDMPIAWWSNPETVASKASPSGFNPFTGPYWDGDKMPKPLRDNISEQSSLISFANYALSKGLDPNTPVQTALDQLTGDTSISAGINASINQISTLINNPFTGGQNVSPSEAWNKLEGWQKAVVIAAGAVVAAAGVAAAVGAGTSGAAAGAAGSTVAAPATTATLAGGTAGAGASAAGGAAVLGGSTLTTVGTGLAAAGAGLSKLGSDAVKSVSDAIEKAGSNAGGAASNNIGAQLAALGPTLAAGAGLIFVGVLAFKGRK